MRSLADAVIGWALGWVLVFDMIRGLRRDIGGEGRPGKEEPWR